MQIVREWMACVTVCRQQQTQQQLKMKLEREYIIIINKGLYKCIIYTTHAHLCKYFNKRGI